jgi:hypothetical protein
LARGDNRLLTIARRGRMWHRFREKMRGESQVPSCK